MATRTQSSLVSYTKLSPNCTTPRNKSVSRLSPHCVAGNLTIEAMLGLSNFQTYNSTSGSSCNYGVGGDGRIGLGVAETNRSWCTSSSVNDHQAITFEIANDGGSPDWHMTDAAVNAWMNLAVDIAKFYGYSKVKYTEKPSSVSGATAVENWIATWATSSAMTITVHCWYAAKACPGSYFLGILPVLVTEINNRLAGKTAVAYVGTRPVLQYGSSGTYVTEAQTKLNKHGANPVLTVDGSFGPGTLTAVNAFQLAKGLTVDGIIGTSTWTELDKEVIVVSTPDYTSYQSIIQSRCQFTSPDAIWTLLNKHQYAESLYKNISGKMSTALTRDECKAIIQARCQFSDPSGIWAVLDMHSYPDDLYRKFAQVLSVNG